jgi:hypothetical protein
MQKTMQCYNPKSRDEEQVPAPMAAAVNVCPVPPYNVSLLRYQGAKAWGLESPRPVLFRILEIGFREDIFPAIG